MADKEGVLKNWEGGEGLNPARLFSPGPRGVVFKTQLCMMCSTYQDGPQTHLRNHLL